MLRPRACCKEASESNVIDIVANLYRMMLWVAVRWFGQCRRRAKQELWEPGRAGESKQHAHRQ